MSCSLTLSHDGSPATGLERVDRCGRSTCGSASVLGSHTSYVRAERWHVWIEARPQRFSRVGQTEDLGAIGIAPQVTKSREAGMDAKDRCTEVRQEIAEGATTSDTEFFDYLLESAGHTGL